MTAFLIAYACVWAVSWVITWGLFFANLQGKHPTLAAECRRMDIGHGVFLGALTGLMGPFGILLALYLTDFGEYGWRLK